MRTPLTIRRFSLAWLFTLVGTLSELVFACPVAADVPQPIEVIEDNSFLIEEAYNQEVGVVQHIFTAQWGENRDVHPHQRGWNLKLHPGVADLLRAAPILLLHSFFLLPQRQ